MNWLHYLLEANLYLGIFYLAYYIFLSTETYYTLNRVYLLLSCVISFVLPVLQVGILKPAEPVLQTVYLLPSAQVALAKTTHIALVKTNFTWQDAAVYLYLAGAAVLLLLLMVKLYQLFKLTKINQQRPDGDYKLVYLNDSNTAFSFFNFLFIGTRAEGAETIIRHELVHIRQKHSADVVFIELLKIVNWFNPVIYLLQISLKTIHEYIADEKTATVEGDALTYSSFLVSNAYGISGSSITHSFFNYNLLKKRIIMLNQQRSGNLARLKYLMALPVCAAMLCASTLAFSKSYGLVDLLPQKADTGHIAPPPPPAPPVRVKLMPPPPPAAPGKMVVFPAPKSPKETTAKGYKYAEGGEMVSGKVYMNVFIYEKNGTHKQYFKESATPAELKLLKDKYGYTFPAKPNFNHFPPPPPPVAPVMLTILPPPPPPKEYGYTSKGYKYRLREYVTNGTPSYVLNLYEKDGTSKKYISNTISLTQRTTLNEKYGFLFPPYSNVSAIKSVVKFPPPVVVADAAPTAKAVDMRLPPPTPPVKVADNRPPPPPPFDPAYMGLFEYLGKHVRYPARAFENKETGNVVVQFNLGSDHKITDVKLFNGSENLFNEEVIRAIKAFPGTITPTADHPFYLTGVTFNITGKNGNKLAQHFNKDFRESNNYTCEADIYSFTKDDIK